MPAQHTSVFSRSRALLLTLALAAGGLGSVGLTAQSASADDSDQLVVLDTTNAGTQGLSGASILTVNADGSATNSEPVPLPTADAGAAKAFALSGDSNGNGALALSADSTSLSVAGYHAVPGPTGVVGIPDPKDTLSTSIQRMVARISATGGTATVDTSTVLSTNTLSTSAPRAAVSTDGQSFFVAGNGGSDSPLAGVIKVPLGGASKTQITDSNQKNVRQVQIAGGQLYATSDKNSLAGFGRFANAGLPTVSTAITQLGGPIVVAASPTKDYVPDAMLLLHTGVNPSPTAIDTAYVVIDTDSSKSVVGEVRKYISSNGTTWTKQSSVKTGDYPFLTGRVAAGKVQLYLTKGSNAANSIVEVDDATPTGDFTAGSETTVATAAAGHAFRGVSLPPANWNPGIAVTAAPTISTANSSAAGTIGDANNPTQDVNLVDSDTPAANLTVTATSSNVAVLPNANITFTGTGATRTATFAPIAKGRATVTFMVKDPQLNTGTTQVFYGASSTPSSAAGHYFYESSDLSSSVDVGSGYALAVSSEDSTLRLYKQNQSGRPVATFDMSGAGAAGIGNDAGDLEGMTRVGNTLYVSGSEGNNSSGDPKPNRRVLFTATISGSGAGTTVTYVGKYNGLWDDLRVWDQAHGNQLGFAAGQAPGVAANNPTGFNIEAFEFAPGSTSTAYLGFRSPLVLHAGKQDAIIVPVTNAGSLVGNPTGTATFGNPIYLDLGGRTIREIRKNSSDEYLISAQADAPTNPQWKLYAWDGKAAHAPIAVKSLPDPASTTTGSWESIVSVPNPLASGASVTLVADSGDTTYYGDATAATDEAKGLRKSYTDDFTLDSFTSFPTVPQNVAAAPTTDGSISVSWDAVSSAASYNVTVKDGANNVSGSPKSVNGLSTTFSGLSNKQYSVTVTAVNANGESDPSSPATTVTPNDVLANSVKPKITGTTVVDQTLTVTPGTWTPAGVTLAYQWAANGTDIPGATGATLILGPDQVGETITVTEKAIKGSSSPVSSTSSATAAVTAGQFLNVAKPTIAGSPQIGVVLAATGAGSFPAADNFTYQWFASDAPATPISGATGSTFTPTAAQVGKTITVQVVAHRAGYTDSFSAKSDPTTAVDPLDVSNSVLPTITGSPAVGSVLTEHDGTWAPGDVSFSYQWLAEGDAISGASGSSFTPTAAELGKKVTVRVTGTKTNLNSYQAESNETAAVAAAPIVNQTAPVLSGAAREGQQLSTTDGTWTPATGLSYSYKWKADDSAVAGAADANTYTLTPNEVGKVITVEVTASKAGYSDGKKTSNASATVDPAAVSNTLVPGIASAAVVGTPITVNNGSWSPSGVTFTYKWLADGTPIAANSTSASFTPTASEFGKKISVTVTGAKSGLTPLDRTSNETTAVTTGIVNDVAPVISGQAIEGKTITTTDGTWTPTPTSFTYVWKSGGIVIAGESTNELVIPAGAAGSSITVEVTAAKDGYISGVKGSAPTGVIDPSDVSNITLPSIPAAPVVGTQLTANHGTWDPPGVSYAYQWLADGNDIATASTSQSFTPTSAESGKKLSVKVTASKSGLTSATETSAETADVTGLPPVFGTPTNLTVTGTTASTITVAWTKSTDATKYRLYYGIGAGTRTKVDVGNVSTVTFTGLKPNQPYTIDISAFKASGTQSAYGPSPRLVGTTDALTAPTDLSVSVRAGTSIMVTWTKVPGVKNYRVTYGIGTGARKTLNVGDVDNANITGLKHGQAYSIDVASLALDKKAVSPASPRINPSTSALLPPTKLKVTGVTATTVTLTWTKAANADSYRLYYGIGSGVRSRVVLGDVSTATVTGLTKGKKYSFDVASVEPDGVGRSSYTTRVSATTK